MFNRFVFASLLAGSAVALPVSVLAQQWPAPPPPAKNMDRLPAAPAQAAQPEVTEPPPPPVEAAPEPKAAPVHAAEPPPKRLTTKHAEKHAAPSHAIACEGTFAKTSSELRLESTYKTQNVAYTQVDGGGGNKVMATVLFPKDPKRRLEVWWSDEEKHRDIYLIVINGKSDWSAPRGVKLGLSLAALEKLNHKPFKLKGLGENGSQVSDWNGGALAHLPGGCKVGVRLRPDGDVAADVREAATGDKEFASTDPAIRAVKPVIAEIILGY